MIGAGALGMGAAVSSHLDPICDLICRVNVCGGNPNYAFAYTVGLPTVFLSIEVVCRCYFA